MPIPFNTYWICYSLDFYWLANKPVSYLMKIVIETRSVWSPSWVLLISQNGYVLFLIIYFVVCLQDTACFDTISLSMCGNSEFLRLPGLLTIVFYLPLSLVELVDCRWAAAWHLQQMAMGPYYAPSPNERVMTPPQAASATRHEGGAKPPQTRNQEANGHDMPTASNDRWLLHLLCHCCPP